MNRLSKWLSIGTLGICLFFVPKAKAQQTYDNYDYSYDDNTNNTTTATYQDFYDGLAPYGQWINDSRYGYVWLPNVGRDFRPYYTNGYWAMTEYGNTWVSNYAWGWAPFHYGRWTYDNYYGWLWIPDTVWGPAWVSWRSNNDYYGWAPMGPGLNINISLGAIPIDWWIFLSPNYLYDHSFYRYYNGYGNNVNIYNQTIYINNIYVDKHSHQSYICGPRDDDYYRNTGHRTPVYNLNDNKRPGGGSIQGNRLSLYRPAINNVSNANLAPRKFVPAQQAVASRPQPLSSNGGRPTGREKVLQQTPVQQSNSRLQPVQNQQAQQPRLQQQTPVQQNTNRLQPVQNQQVQQPRLQQQTPVQQNTNRLQPVQNQQQDQQRLQQVQMQQQRAQQQAQQDQQRQQQVQMQQQRAQQQAQQDQQRQQQVQMQQQRAQQQAQQAQMQQQRTQQQAQQNQQRQQQVQMQQQRAQQQAQQAQMQQQRAQQQAQQNQQRQQQMQMQQQRAPQPQARPVEEQHQEGRR